MLFSNEAERYLLIQTLPNGTPKAVQPVANLEAGESKIVKLIHRREDGWYLFDTKERRTVWPRDRVRSQKHSK